MKALPSNRSSAASGRRCHPGLMPLAALCCAGLVGCVSEQHAVQPMPSPFVVKTADINGSTRQPPYRAAAMPFRTSEPTVNQENDPPFGHATPSPSNDPSSTRSENDPNAPKTMLSFVNADVPGVVQALAKFTGKNFVVDPRVKGQLNLISQEPVDANTAYAMLLSALRMQGFTVVNVDGVNRVVPEADAKLQGVSVATGQQAGPPTGELTTRVFQLRYENAANLVPILRPMIAPNNTINAYPGNNTLVITDYSDNLNRIAQVIASIDRADAFSTDVVPVRHGLALDVAALASQMLRSSEGQSANPTVVLADTRSNAVLIRANSPDRLNMAKRLIRRIDSPETAHGNLNVVYLRNAQATQLAQVLRGLLSGHNHAAGAAQTQSMGQDFNPMGQQAGPQGTAHIGSPYGNQLSNQPGNLSGHHTPNLQGANPDAAHPFDNILLEPVGFTAGGATVQADPATNTLLISAPPPIYRNLRQVIDQLDQRRSQVLVETLIVEVNAENAAEFGIQWMAGGNNLGPSSGTGFIGGANFGGTGINRNGITTIDSLGAGLSLGVVSGSVNVLGNQILNLGFLARAMQSKGDVNVLSTPNLMTLDNEQASIMVGRTVPFVTGQYTTSGDGASNPFQTITREDVGLTLRVRPQISEGGTVKLSIYQEVSSIDTAASNAINGIVTRKRALDTDVLIDDGQIIVLGGLLEDEITDDTSSVPVLGDIPVLGQLFRYDSRRRTKTNLMVFLRPHIIRDARDSASVTMDRYNYMRAAQENLPPRQTWFDPNAKMSQLPSLERNTNTGLIDLRGINPADVPAAPARPTQAAGTL